jgi:hypothetical protein
MDMLHAGQRRGTSGDNNFDASESLIDPDSMWFVCPQLFFHCMLLPIGTRLGCYNSCYEDIQLDLIFHPTSSAEFLLFHAFWTEMQPQLFHISTEPTEGRFQALLCLWWWP